MSALISAVGERHHCGIEAAKCSYLRASVGRASARLGRHSGGHRQGRYEAASERTGVGPDTRYLDIGCGAGGAAQLPAGRGANVSGIDAADTLLAIAREGTSQGDFHIGDLKALPFDDGLFDVVTEFYSFQYAANPAVALGEARRVTKAEGVILVMTGGMPDGMEAASLVSALRQLLPPTPPGAAGPFALSDETALRAFAAAAGLTPFEVFDVESSWSYPYEATAVRGLNSSGGAARAMENFSAAVVSEAHRQALAPFRHAGGGFRTSATFRCLLARP